MRRRLILLTISIVSGLIVAELLFGGVQTFFDIYGPTITVKNSSKYVGLRPQDFEFKLQDISGVRRARIQLFQNKRRIDERNFDLNGEKNAEINYTVDTVGNRLRQGSYRLVMSAVDQSIRANRSTVELEFLVDFTRPRIISLTSMHNVRRGGLELLFYEIVNDASVAECVIPDGKSVFFPGILARAFGIPARPTVKGALFSPSVSSEVKRLLLVSYARNFDPYFFRFPQLILDLKPRRSFIQPSIYEKVLELSRRLELESRRYVLEVCEMPATVRQCFIDNSFLKPFPKASYYSTFGQQIATQDKNPIFLLEDVFWITAFESEVISPTKGMVESYDRYTVTLDLGCGLRSHLYPIENLLVAVGEEVQRGQLIGTVSRNFTDFTGHRLSLWGVPINPRELEDFRWVSDHLISKINFMRSQQRRVEAPQW